MTLDPELLTSFDSLEDARKELNKHKTSIREFDSPIGKMFEVVEYTFRTRKALMCGTNQNSTLICLMKMETVLQLAVSYQSAEEIFNKDDRELKIVLP